MSETPTKRPRLSTSCNWCRSHKLKCDTEQPSCSNCRRRNVECITTDLRRPGSVGRRTEGGGRQKKRNDSVNKDPVPDPENHVVGSPLQNGEQNWVEPSQSRTPDATPATGSESQSLQGNSSRTNSRAQNAASELPIFSLPFDLDDRDVGATAPVLAGGSASVPKHSVGSDIAMLMDNTTGKLQMMGISSSLYILIQWLDLFFAQHPDWSPIFPSFRRGMAYSVEMPLPFPMSLPPLPSRQEQETLISIFAKKIQPIFPVLDLDEFRSSVIASTAKMERDPSTLDPQDYPALACTYAVFSISADEKHGCITFDGTNYLQAAYFLHAYLLAMPYVESVQALLLLSIVLRSRNKDGASWGTLGQAIRMAQSIGLHRQTQPNGHSDARQPHTEKAADLHSRIWWTAYCLERTMELEIGRPSAIQDSECDQVLPSISPCIVQDVASFDYFRALIDLAKIQTEISDRLYRKKPVKRQTEQLLHDSGMLDRKLLDWVEKLPEGIRPGRDIFWDPEQGHLATFLSLQFNNTLISLHRPALMSGALELRERVDVYCSGTLWRFRLRNSMCICASAARSTVRAMNDLAWQQTHSRLITVTHVTLAMVVLAIYISRTKSLWINESDLALLKNCSEYAEQQYIQMGQDPEFIRVCTLVRSQLTEHVYGPKGVGFANKFQAVPSLSIPTPCSMEDAVPPAADFGNDFFGGTEFDELWPYLWGDDLSQVYLSGAESNVLNKHLLGLPGSELNEKRVNSCL